MEDDWQILSLSVSLRLFRIASHFNKNFKHSQQLFQFCFSTCSLILNLIKNNVVKGILPVLGLSFNNKVQYALDLRKILGVAKKFLKSRSFLFQTLQNP